MINNEILNNILLKYKDDIIYIYTTKYGYYISNCIKYILEKNMYKCKIINNINHKNENLHIIFFPQKINIFPKNYIIYQLEQ